MYLPDVEVEKSEIIKRYRNLLRVWKPRAPADRISVKKAFKMALEAHKDMRRKSGEPYIYHPLSVATIAAGEIGLGTTSVICALLHDVVEDTEYTIEDIRGLFGDKVAAIIDGLTKIKGIFDQKSVSIGAENFKKILLTLSDDVRVILIKLADRLHNMRTLDALSHEKRVKISSETTYLYAPLAHRLGLHAIKSELEDLALKYTEPEVYETISRKLKETAKGRSRFVNKFIYPIKKALTLQGFRYTIQAREKSIAAIWLKMQKKEVPFEEVYDIFAIRIVIDSPVESEKSDCWKVYSAITDFYRPNMDRLRDWISIPKANGYEALHTTVMSHTGQWVEIQIRSKRMDEVAEKGYAAHWKYKESMHLNSRLDNWLDRIKEMIESPDSDALSFIDDVKGYFFLEEISVFTPQGELRTLPANSTVLDFAYAIHSELGDTCIGAKIDKKLAPINQKLKNGQQVEIITSRKQSPKEEWLSYVVTTRAKTNIKLAVRGEKKKFAKPGKEKLAKWFLQCGIEFTNETIRKFQASVNFNSFIDLYYAAYQDKIGFKDVKIFGTASFNTGWKTPGSGKTPGAKPRIGAGAGQTEKFPVLQGILIPEEGPQGQIRFDVAECCNPIPGDEVIGLMSTPESPLVLHRTNCSRIHELITVFNNKMVSINWTNRESITFLAEIKLLGLDKLGLINEITKIMSNELNLNIKSLRIEAINGITEGIISFYVHNTSNIDDAMNKIMGIDGITNVTRINKI
ncbi:MAG: RelA/SpoT family protein [Bacteroidales bacterium]|nr:RelA/SpoT family protein [Bacteroidales bacterium]HNW72565.1 RelA/SpoT family protein [Bacteroidales bacterium]